MRVAILVTSLFALASSAALEAAVWQLLWSRDAALVEGIDALIESILEES